ncbi:hypothetical protein T484DRAFT_1795752 [Baffinella frigidus]|nr:hypothetical protein T484DRAFT_1795752 [Cryptophyta sp. CCMP2293]
MSKVDDAMHLAWQCGELGGGDGGGTLGLRLGLGPQQVFRTELAKCDNVPSNMSWTRTIYSTSVEDDAVLRVIPYFADNDTEGVDLSLYDRNE